MLFSDRTLIAAGFVMGGVIIKKLNDISDEIRHIERYKRIETKKEYEKRRYRDFKEWENIYKDEC